jgi:hypothetical protein
MVRLFVVSLGNKEDETVQQQPVDVEMELLDQSSANTELKQDEAHGYPGISFSYVLCSLKFVYY